MAAPKTTKRKKAASNPATKTAAKTTKTSAKVAKTATKATASKVKKAAKPKAAAKKVARPAPKISQIATVLPSYATQNKAMEKMMTKSKNQFEQFTAQFTNGTGEIGREGMEAIMKCGNIWMKGCEDIIQTATSIAQEAAEKQSQYMKEAMSAKTLNEWAETQNKIAQASFDDFMRGMLL